MEVLQARRLALPGHSRLQDSETDQRYFFSNFAGSSCCSFTFFSADLYKRLWFNLNKVFPRRLWTQTVEAIVNVDGGAAASSSSSIGSRRRKGMAQEDLVLDPLQILRCDRRALRCGPALEIVLYILKVISTGLCANNI